MPDNLYATRDEALQMARDNIPARRQLAMSGPNHVIVAEVAPRDSQWEIVEITVKPDGHPWNTVTNRFVVRKHDGLTCVVCERVGFQDGEWATPSAQGYDVSGLSPSSCSACHDTLTTQGIAPMARIDGEWVPVERPDGGPPVSDWEVALIAAGAGVLGSGITGYFTRKAGKDSITGQVEIERERRRQDRIQDAYVTIRMHIDRWMDVLGAWEPEKSPCSHDGTPKAEPPAMSMQVGVD